MTFGQVIAILRKEKHFKQSELAQRLGVTQSMVAKWKGEQARPRQQTLQQLAQILGVSKEELLAYDSDPDITVAAQSKPAVLEIVQQLPHLADDQIEALRVIVRDMQMRSQMQSLFQRQKAG